MTAEHIFDDWVDRYDAWFDTAIGKLIRRYESELIVDMLKAETGDFILDAGCGTGVFTRCLFSRHIHVMGIDVSLPMLMQAGRKLLPKPFEMVLGEMSSLPFSHCVFDKTMSITALEFIEDARKAVGELFRVTRPGGRVLVATLNSLSPWANRRKISGEKGHPIFKHVFFRSPDDMRALFTQPPLIRTAIHFEKDEDPVQAEKLEKKGRAAHLETGAFLVAVWNTPGHRL